MEKIVTVAAAGLITLSAAARAETIGGLAFADATRHAAAMSPTDAYIIVGSQDLMALSPIAGDGTIRTIVEIPTGTSAKWEVSKDDPRAVYWEYRNDAPRIVNYPGYPGNYGSIPGTPCPGKWAATAIRSTCRTSGRPCRGARSSMCA